MAYCLRSFIETLDQVLNPEKHYKKWVLDREQRPKIKSLFDNATFLQDFLDKATPQTQEVISHLEVQIMDAAQEAADILDTYITDQMLLNPEDQASTIIPSNLRPVIQDGSFLNPEDHAFTISPPDLEPVIQVFQDAKQNLSNDPSQPYDHIVLPSVSSSTHYPDSEMVVGLKEDLDKLRDELLSDEKKLNIITIAGMGGIGKTTLARILYDELSSSKHFDCCAWATVSQSYDPQQVLKSILACLTKETPQEDACDLKTAVHKALNGRRYLIVLDDIWSVEAWSDVSNAFSRDAEKGSRIIFTTRENSLVKAAQSSRHEMRLINKEKSFELFSRKVFGKEPCPSEYMKVGERIALNCGGLPLALQVIGGILAHSKRSEEDWEKVANSVSSLIAKTDEKLARIFSLSFAHLPHYLKPCFLYMGAFPEDYEIPTSRIIKLWIAEGFLYPYPNQSLEESAKTHLKALVDRNLIFVRRWRWNGKARSYGIHDLLRDFCLKKAQEKKFLYVKDSKTNTVDEDKLCFRCVSVHLARNVDNYYGSERKSFARSFLVNGHKSHSMSESKFCGKSPLLRVLDLFSSENYGVKEKGFGDDVFEQVFLRLVNLRCLTIHSSSRGMSVLTNLQTLKVRFLESFAILDHLPQLIHLEFLYLEDKDSSQSLEIEPHVKLQSLLTVPRNYLTYFLEKFPNLGKLVISVGTKDPSPILNLKCFKILESLNVEHDWSLLDINIIFPQSLKKLKLCKCTLSPTLNAIGSLPELLVLKFTLCEFENDTWEPSEDEFLKLQYLEIYGSKLQNWSACERYFPSLQHLVLRDCSRLDEISVEIGDITTLETIELYECKASVFESALMIHEKVEREGNTIFFRLGHTTEDTELVKAKEQLKVLENDP